MDAIKNERAHTTWHNYIIWMGFAVLLILNRSQINEVDISNRCQSNTSNISDVLSVTERPHCSSIVTRPKGVPLSGTERINVSVKIDMAKSCGFSGVF
jgi:ABC-type phosphate/phosphonate transport system permease subunit